MSENVNETLDNDINKEKSNGLNKKNFTIITMSAFVSLALLFLVLLSYARPAAKEIEIIVPAGTEMAYSETTFTATRNKVKITTGKNISDTLVQLKPVEVKEENIYEGDYLTTGLEVEFDVEKCGVFKVGVIRENKSDKDIVVSVRIKGIEINKK